MYLKVISPSNKVLIYDSQQTTYKNLGLQVGISTLPPKVRTTRANQTPKKAKKRELVKPKLPTLSVKGIPSSKKPKKVFQKKTVTGKCKICRKIWESKDDLAFRKKEGVRKTTWIGCDQDQCSFWAHASCAGMLLIPKKKVKDHVYYCDAHRKRK